ncbi:type IVB secretion system protein DotC [soil metagenome]
MKTNFYLLILLILSATALCGCAHQYNGGTGSYGDLQRLRKGYNTTGKTDGISKIRRLALHDTAMSISARCALAWRAKQINGELSTKIAVLDKSFDFNVMLLDNNVLPPVLMEGREVLNLAGPDVIRLADRVYRIESQARFVTTPPTWRDYLWMNYPQPDIPDRSLLPKNAKERYVWLRAIELGWREGINQGNAIFAENVARLKRDYSGMILYRKLYAQHMVTAPYVATTSLGVTGGGSNMRINDKILRITALPSLQANSNAWRPVISNDNAVDAR